MKEIRIRDADLVYEEPTDVQGRGKIVVERTDDKTIMIQITILRGQRSTVVATLSEEKARLVRDAITEELEAKGEDEIE